MTDRTDKRFGRETLTAAYRPVNMLPEWFPSLILFTMPASIVGYAVGRIHIRHLAFHGGESKYPEPIPETVEAYRELYHVEELQRTSFGLLLSVPVTVTIALSAVTIGLLIGHFSIGYYFATRVIRGLADVDGADEPQIFDTDERAGTATAAITAPETTDDDDGDANDDDSDDGDSTKAP